jgi:hypothetical protein
MKALWVVLILIIVAGGAGGAFFYFSKERDKVAPPKNAALAGEIPKSFDAKKCDELLDLAKFPATPMNGKLYSGGKEQDFVVKGGQARIKGDILEIKLFSAERAGCAEAGDGTAVTLKLNKSEIDTKGDKAALTYGWDRFGKQPLEYFYGAAGAETKEPLAGLVGGLSVEAKEGGKVKGKGILCFAHPDASAAPIPQPADYEEGDPLPPAGLRHALAGDFVADFCPTTEAPATAPGDPASAPGVPAPGAPAAPTGAAPAVTP